MARPKRHPERQLEYLDHLRNCVLACEAQFGISSNGVQNDIDHGRLVETLEVCEWLVDLYALEQATRVDQ